MSAPEEIEERLIEGSALVLVALVGDENDDGRHNADQHCGAKQHW
jgi:hypothetical protein